MWIIRIWIRRWIVMFPFCYVGKKNWSFLFDVWFKCFAFKIWLCRVSVWSCSGFEYKILIIVYFFCHRSSFISVYGLSILVLRLNTFLVSSEIKILNILVKVRQCDDQWIQLPNFLIKTYHDATPNEVWQLSYLILSLNMADFT